VNDVVNTLSRIFWEKDEERKKTMTIEFLTVAFPVFLKAMSTRLEESFAQGGKYLLGSKLTTADIMLATFTFSLIYNDENTEAAKHLRPVFEHFPNLTKFADNIRPEFAGYLEARPKRTR
jgi:glutathione S-transferase